MEKKTDLEIIQLACNVLRIIVKVLKIVAVVVSAILAVCFVLFLLSAIIGFGFGDRSPADGMGSCLVGAELAAVAAYIFRKSELYFVKELADGTPFTMEGALLFRRLGVLDAVVSLCSGIVAWIVLAIFKCDDLHIDLLSGVWTGLLIIAASYVLSYGASIAEGKKEE